MGNTKSIYKTITKDDKVYSGYFDKDDLLNGKGKIEDLEGNLISSGTYCNGTLAKNLPYRITGQAKLDDYYPQYNDGMKKMRGFIIKDGKKYIGTFSCYSLKLYGQGRIEDLEGNLISSGTYRDGELQTYKIPYCITGQADLKQSGDYRIGFIIIGDFKYTGTFYHNTLHGEGKIEHIGGNFISSGTYNNGVLDITKSFKRGPITDMRKTPFGYEGVFTADDGIIYHGTFTNDFKVRNGYGIVNGTKKIIIFNETITETILLNADEEGVEEPSAPQLNEIVEKTSAPQLNKIVEEGAY